MNEYHAKQSGIVKFDASINIGQILIAASFIASAAVAFFAVRTDVEVLKVHVAQLAASDALNDKRAAEFRNEVVDQLKQMNIKLEGIKERMDKFEGSRR